MSIEWPINLETRVYKIADAALLTPALLIYSDVVRHNIQCIISALGNEPGRWRPHVKTVKLASMMKLLVDAGVTTAKCATTLELQTACQAGMTDVLVAYPHTGRNAERVIEIAHAFPGVRISALVESEEQIGSWTNSPVSLFIDINTGMNRTGIERDHLDRIQAVARQIQAVGIAFRGLHFYDGNSAEPDLQERTRSAHARYAELVALASRLAESGNKIGEIVTSGTPALPCAIAYAGLWNGPFTHQVSPGTVVYNDTASLKQIPESFGLRPAVLVLSRVISHPKSGVVTCDAGHKGVAVDSGVPNCSVWGYPDLRALKPSEEHLPFEVLAGTAAPGLGEVLYLIPRHVCPTVNNYDFAAVIEEGALRSVDRVSARGHEGPV